MNGGRGLPSSIKKLFYTLTKKYLWKNSFMNLDTIFGYLVLPIQNLIRR